MPEALRIYCLSQEFRREEKSRPGDCELRLESIEGVPTSSRSRRKFATENAAPRRLGPQFAQRTQGQLLIQSAYGRMASRAASLRHNLSRASKGSSKQEGHFLFSLQRRRFASQSFLDAFSGPSLPRRHPTQPTASLASARAAATKSLSRLSSTISRAEACGTKADLATLGRQPRFAS